MKKITILLLLCSVMASAQCFKKVVSGHDHILAIGQDGTLWAWASNEFGQMGDPSYVGGSNYPVQIGATGWKAIAGGEKHSLAIKEDGTLWAWGKDTYSQLGNGNGNGDSPFPIQIGVESDWKEVTAGLWASAAIKTNGTLWTWGSNWYGSLGNGTSQTYESWIPQQVGTETNWKNVSGSFTQITHNTINLRG